MTAFCGSNESVAGVPSLPTLVAPEDAGTQLFCTDTQNTFVLNF